MTHSNNIKKITFKDDMGEFSVTSAMVIHYADRSEPCTPKTFKVLQKISALKGFSELQLGNMAKMYIVTTYK